jgi:hypothetical protein
LATTLGIARRQLAEQLVLGRRKRGRARRRVVLTLVEHDGSVPAVRYREAGLPIGTLVAVAISVAISIAVAVAVAVAIPVAVSVSVSISVSVSVSISISVAIAFGGP